MIKRVIASFFAIMFGIMCVGCGQIPVVPDITIPTTSLPTTTAPANNPKVGETFVFDDLEICISETYEFTTVDNQFSEYHNKPVVKIPVTVKNLSNESHNLNFLYVNAFGSSGTQIDIFTMYFDDSVIVSAGSLRPGASYTKYFYIPYDGDGKYTFEFKELFSSPIDVDINIKK